MKAPTYLKIEKPSKKTFEGPFEEREILIAVGTRKGALALQAHHLVMQK
jgi:hypothetical protein